jgi:hypothetical protein
VALESGWLFPFTLDSLTSQSGLGFSVVHWLLSRASAGSDLTCDILMEPVR